MTNTFCYLNVHLIWRKERKCSLSKLWNIIQQFYDFYFWYGNCRYLICHKMLNKCCLSAYSVQSCAILLHQNIIQTRIIKIIICRSLHKWWNMGNILQIMYDQFLLTINHVSTLFRNIFTEFCMPQKWGCFYTLLSISLIFKPLSTWDFWKMFISFYRLQVDSIMKTEDRFWKCFSPCVVEISSLTLYIIHFSNKIPRHTSKSWKQIIVLQFLNN